MTKRLALLFSLAAAGSTFSFEDTTSYFVRANGRDEAYLWKASSSGALSFVPPAFAIWSTGGYSNAIPVVSPDSKKLVFARSGDLWIRDLATSDERRITDAARPYDGEYSWVSIEVRGWSPHSDRLMYEIVRPDRFPRDSCGWSEPLPVIRDAPYGLYLYDLKAGASRSVTLPGEFAAWISNEDVAANTNPNRFQFISTYARVKLGSVEQKPLPFPANRSCGQLASDPEGSWLVASCCSAQKCQIMEMNLRDGQLRAISVDGEFAEFQWPTFSPSGRRIAWIRQSRPPWDQPLGSLVVDSKEVFSCKESESSLVGYHWIDDDTVVCVCLNDLFVVDVSTGTADTPAEPRVRNGHPDVFHGNRRIE